MNNDQNRSKKTLRPFSVRDYALIAVTAALGIAVKSVLTPLIQVASSPLFIPGGSLIGGLYMMWLVVISDATGKFGAAAMTGFIQAMLVTLSGIGGSHGLLSFVSYTLPGLVVDLSLLPARNRGVSLPLAFISCVLANLCGTLSVNIIFFRLPAVPLLLALASAAFSGGVGGVIAWHLIKALRRRGVIK